MERTLYGGALALGGVVWLCCLLLTRRNASGQRGADETMPEWYAQIPLAHRIAAIALPVLGFIATLPSEAPFATGQGLGRGFLLGALASWLSLWSVGRARLGSHSIGTGDEAGTKTDGARNRVAIVAPFAICVVVTAIPMLMLRDVVQDALMGIAMGLLTVGALSVCGLRNDGNRRTAILSSSVIAGALFGTTLCAILAMGEIGGSVKFGNSLVPGPWSAPLLVLASVVPLLLLLVLALVPQLVSRVAGAHMVPAKRDAAILLGNWLGGARLSAVNRDVATLLICWLVGGGALLAVGKLLDGKLDDGPGLFQLLVIGLGASGLAWWNISVRTGSAQDSRSQFRSFPSLALPLLLLMIACMVSFQMYAGIAVCVVALGAWLTCGIALGGTTFYSDNTSDNASDNVSENAIEIKEQRAASSENQSGNIEHKATQGGARALPVQAIADTMLRVVGVVTLFLLYRLFQVKYSDDFRNVVLLDHYALLGVGVGALVPSALWSYIQSKAGSGNSDPEHSDRPTAGLWHLFATGALLLLVPGVLLVIYGTKCLLAIFIGLTLATAVRHPGVTSTESRGAVGTGRGDLLVALFAVGIAVAMVQWTHHLLPVGLMARADKIRLLTYGTGFVALLMLLAEFVPRLHGGGTPPQPLHSLHPVETTGSDSKPALHPVETTGSDSKPALHPVETTDPDSKPDTTKGEAQ